MSDFTPGFIIEPGADTALNGSRRIGVRWAIIHRPQGRCPSVVGLGQTRRHSSPGTFNACTCDDGHGHGFYPHDVKCSHAAGANTGGPGNEVDGFQGELIGDGALLALGQWVLDLSATHGLPPALYPPEAPRVWLDRNGPVAGFGFYGHLSVDYPPDRSLNHYDGPTSAEFQRAIALAGGSAPARRRRSDMHIGFVPNAAGKLAYVVDGGVMLDQLKSDPRDPTYGLPQSALDMGAKMNLYFKDYTLEGWAMVMARTNAVPTVGGGSGAPIDVAAIAHAAAVAAVEEHGRRLVNG